MLTVVDTGPDIFGCIAVLRATAPRPPVNDDDAENDAFADVEADDDAVKLTGPNGSDVGDDDDTDD